MENGLIFLCEEVLVELKSEIERAMACSKTDYSRLLKLFPEVSKALKGAPIEGVSASPSSPSGSVTSVASGAASGAPGAPA